MQKAGYGPDKHLAVKVSTRNIPVYRDPAVILIDQLKSIYIDGELDVVDTAQWFPKVARKDYALGLNLTGNAVDDPDQSFYENYSCGSERNYTNYCNKDIEKLFDQQSAGDRRRQAQEAGLGDRQEAAGRRRPSDHLPRPHRHLLAALCQGRHRHGEQLLQWLSLRRRLAGQVASAGDALERRRSRESSQVFAYIVRRLVSDARDPVRDLDHHLRAAAHRARQHRRHPVRRRGLRRSRRQGQSGAGTRARSIRSSCNICTGSAACCTAISAIPMSPRSRRWTRSCRGFRSPRGWPAWRCCSRPRSAFPWASSARSIRARGSIMPCASSA